MAPGELKKTIISRGLPRVLAFDQLYDACLETSRGNCRTSELETVGHHNGAGVVTYYSDDFEDLLFTVGLT